MKKIKEFILYGLILGLTMAFFYFRYSDNPFQKSLKQGAIMTSEQYQELKKDKSSDGKRIAFIGRIQLDTSFTYKFGRPVVLPLIDANHDAFEHIPFDLAKDDKNSIYVPSEFTEKNLIIYDNEGKAHSYDEEVMVSFTMERITEAIPEQNPNTGEYAWRCKLIRIDPVE